MSVEKIKRAMTKKSTPPSYSGDLSTGCTLLNLAMTDRAAAGYCKGQYYLLVGDSASGKSWLGMSALAEASLNKAFDGHRLVYGDEENGTLMDVSRFFGGRLQGRIEKVRHGYVEDFYDYLDDAFKGKPFVYVCDSMDALKSREDEEKRQEQKKARASGKDVSGSYGTAKPKCNSANMPWVASRLEATGSVLLVICQTRDNIGFGAQFNPKTRSGGTAVRFYAHLEVWTSTRQKIKRAVMGKPRQVGMLAQAKVKKNRVTGKDRTVEFPIYWSHGIDDTGACVNYLLAEKHWKGTENSLEAPEFSFKGRADDLVQKVEAEGREAELAALAESLWRQIDDKCAVRRKNRYE